jgi:hypothetical protein
MRIPNPWTAADLTGPRADLTTCTKSYLLERVQQTLTSTSCPFYAHGEPDAVRVARRLGGRRQGNRQPKHRPDASPPTQPHCVVGSPAAAADELEVALWDDSGATGADRGAAKALADR